MVTWRSKKYFVVARSSVEAKFQAMAHRLWIKIIFSNLRISWEGFTKLYRDNKLGFGIAYNPVQCNWIKHVKVNLHFTKEKPDGGLIYTPYIFSKRQLTNILPKGPAAQPFHSITNKLRVKTFYSPTWGECWRMHAVAWLYSLYTLGFNLGLFLFLYGWLGIYFL